VGIQIRKRYSRRWRETKVLVEGLEKQKEILTLSVDGDDADEDCQAEEYHSKTVEVEAECQSGEVAIRNKEDGRRSRSANNMVKSGAAVVGRGAVISDKIPSLEDILIQQIKSLEQSDIGDSEEVRMVVESLMQQVVDLRRKRGDTQPEGRIGDDVNVYTVSPPSSNIPTASGKSVAVESSKRTSTQVGGTSRLRCRGLRFLPRMERGFL
ncbi:hypothetical protein KC19_VG183300, partial [Ceratodon purpureus]